MSMDDRTSTTGRGYAGAGAGARTDYPRAERPTEERPLSSVVRDLVQDGRTLLRQEAELAKAEVRHKVSVYERNVGAIAIGGVLLLAALLAVLYALNMGLTALLAEWLGLGIGVWLAPLLLGALFGMVGWTMIGKGRRAIAREGVLPEQTVDELRREKDWAKERVK